MDGEAGRKEREFLESLCATYRLEGSPYARIKREMVIRTFAPFLRRDAGGRPEGKMLALGGADGYEMLLISRLSRELHVLEGSKAFAECCEKMKPKNTRVFNVLFEEYGLKTGEEKYDGVFACYVLEHVAQVEPVLKMTRSALKPTGFLFAAVPNARALSRQIALNMGILKDLKELTENDLAHGHRRVYDMHTLRRDMEACGFEVVASGGVILKILADFQLDMLLEDGFLKQEHFEALYQLGMNHPDFSDTLYAVCRAKG